MNKPVFASDMTREQSKTFDSRFAEPICYEPSMRNALMLCRNELYLARIRAQQAGDHYFAYCYKNAIDKADAELSLPIPQTAKEGE